MKHFRHRLEYAAFRLLAFFVNLLPESLFYALARTFGWLAFHLFRVRRAVTLSNLELAFGATMSEAQRRRLAARAYRHIAMTMFEVLRPRKIAARLNSMVAMDDLPVLREIMARGKGVILVSCHCGGWELTGASVAACGPPPTVVAATMSNPYVDRYVNAFRRALGMEMLPLTASAKELVRVLRKRQAIGLISDQNAGPHGVFVDFFGLAASTPRGAAQLGLKFKTPLLVTVALRTAPGRYRNVMREVEVHDDDTVESLTQRYTTIMEEIIRSHPEQYFWMHRRWKTRPAGESGVSGGR